MTTAIGSPFKGAISTSTVPTVQNTSTCPKIAVNDVTPYSRTLSNVEQRYFMYSIDALEESSGYWGHFRADTPVRQLIHVHIYLLVCQLEFEELKNILSNHLAACDKVSIRSYTLIHKTHTEGNKIGYSRNRKYGPCNIISINLIYC